MNLKALLKGLKSRWLSILFCGLIIVFLFNLNAKAWVLQQILSTHIFLPDIKKEISNKNTSPTANFSFSDENGNTATISELKGKVIFINFWASWCPPCRAEMPSLDKLYTRLKNDNRFVFLFINEDEDYSKAIAFLKSKNFEIPVYKSQNIPATIFTGTLPTTIVLDKDGHIVLKHEGMAAYDSNNFYLQLKALL